RSWQSVRPATVPPPKTRAICRKAAPIDAFAMRPTPSNAALLGDSTLSIIERRSGEFGITSWNERSFGGESHITQIPGFAGPEREFPGEMAKEGCAADAETEVIGHSRDQAFDPKSPIVIQSRGHFGPVVSRTELALAVVDIDPDTGPGSAVIIEQAAGD